MLDAQNTPQAPHAVRLADYRPPDWLIPEVALDFDLDAVRTIVKARLSVVRNGAHDRPLVLDGQGLELLGLKVDGMGRAERPPRRDADAGALRATPRRSRPRSRSARRPTPS